MSSKLKGLMGKQRPLQLGFCPPRTHASSMASLAPLSWWETGLSSLTSCCLNPKGLVIFFFSLSFILLFFVYGNSLMPWPYGHLRQTTGSKHMAVLIIQNKNGGAPLIGTNLILKNCNYFTWCYFFWFQCPLEINQLMKATMWLNNNSLGLWRAGNEAGVKKNSRQEGTENKRKL